MAVLEPLLRAVPRPGTTWSSCVELRLAIEDDRPAAGACSPRSRASRRSSAATSTGRSPPGLARSPKRRPRRRPRQALERLAAATGNWGRPGARSTPSAWRRPSTPPCNARSPCGSRRSTKASCGDLARAADFCARRRPAGRRGPRPGGARTGVAQAGRERRARRDPVARGRGGRRSGEAGRLPGGARRGAARRARRTPTARSPPSATRSSEPGARARARRRWASCSIAPRRARARSTCSSRWPRRAATTRSSSPSTSGGWRCATIAPSARTGCARSPRSAPIGWATPDAPLAALGRALLKEEPIGGRRARRSRADRAAAQAVSEGAARSRPRSTSPSPRPRGSWRCEPRSSTARPATPRRPSDFTDACSTAIPENLDALAALEGLYRSGRSAASLAAMLERRAEVEIDPRLRRGRLLEAARLHEGQGEIADGDRGAAEVAVRRRGRRRAARRARAALRGAGNRRRAGGGAGRARPPHRRCARPRRGSVVTGRRAAPRRPERSRRRGRRLSRGARCGARRRPGARRRWRRSRRAARTGRRCRRCCCAGSARSPAPIRRRSCSSWRATPSSGSRTSIRRAGFLRQLLEVESGQRVRLPRAGTDPAHRTTAGTTWWTCSASTPTWKARPAASRPSSRCGSPSPTSGSRS